MNKELKKQVKHHGEQINGLFTRVYKLEDKVMRNDYTLHFRCPNCCREQWFTLAIGELRPKKFICDGCRCEVEPTEFGW